MVLTGAHAAGRRASEGCRSGPVRIFCSLSWITENVQSTDFDLENYGSMRVDEDRTGPL